MEGRYHRAVADKKLSLWFDYSCPYAYLASTHIEALAARTGATLVWEPMLLGGVFRAAGTPQNLNAALGPAKAKHNAADMHRWAARFGVPLTVPAEHPRRTVEALRATLLAGIDPRVIHGLYRAYWVEGRDVADRAVIAAVLDAAGHDGAALVARLDDAAVKEDLVARTARAVDLGVFGAPTTIVGDELFWGQDRLDFVERALGGSPPPPAPSTSSHPHVLDAYFDFSSPFAYLGMTQVEAVAARTSATLRVRPMLLGAVFKDVGQVTVPLSTFSPAKQRHVARDLERWAAHWGVPYRFPTRFPMSSVRALRVYLSLEDEGERRAFRDAVFRAYWADDEDISTDEVLARHLPPSADAAAVLARSQTPEIKQALFDATRTAVEAGVFGAPTFVVDGTELFWGQDRLGLVEAALSAPREAPREAP